MAAATTYETTCPNCGEDFDVKSSDKEADCPACRAHLVFRDEEAERRKREKELEKKRKEKEAARKRAAEQKARAAEQAKKAAAAKAKEKEKQKAEREEAKLRAAEQKARAAEHAKKIAEAKAAQKEAEKAERDALKADKAADKKSAREKFLTRPDRSPGRRQGIPVIDVEGIGPSYEKKLNAVKIMTTDHLLAADEHKLADKTGIPIKKIRAWQDMCDLMHLPGVGPQYAELLVRTDINSVKELSVQTPKDLAKRVKQTVDSVGVKITGGGIGEKRAKAIIAEAQKIYPPDEDPGEKALHEAQAASGPAKLPREPRGEHKGGKSLEELEREKEKAAKQKQKAVDAKEKEKAAAAKQKEKEAAKAKKLKAKEEAKQAKQDRKDAKKLAKQLAVDQDVALSLVQANVRSVEDLAGQDPQSLHKKVKGGGA